MKEFVKKGPKLDETIDIHSVVGRRVITKSGKQVGRVKQVRVRKGEVTGVTVRKLAGTPIYIGMSYIKDITPEAVLLDINPALYEGRKVITSDGKSVGKVKSVIRKGTTNDVTGLAVRAWFRTHTIPAGDIKSFGPTIMLKKTYEDFRS